MAGHQSSTGARLWTLCGDAAANENLISGPVWDSAWKVSDMKLTLGHHGTGSMDDLITITPMPVRRRLPANPDFDEGVLLRPEVGQPAVVDVPIDRKPPPILAGRQPWPSIDPDTSIGNQPYFWHDLERRAAEYARGGRTFSMLIAQHNGNAEGFVRLCTIIRSSCRLEDTVCNLGEGVIGALIGGLGANGCQGFVERVAEASDWRPGDHLHEDAPWFGMAAWDADGVTDAASLAALVQTDMEAYQRSALSQRRAWGSRE